MAAPRVLKVLGQPQCLEHFLQRITTAAPDHWRYAPEVRTEGTACPLLTFRPRASAPLPACVLCLAQLDAHQVKVQAIVPTEQADLSAQDYEALLEDFHATVILPAARATAVLVAFPQH
jgi:hypothetical protein